LPLSAGGTSTCVVNRVNGAVTGTANIESGAGASSLKLISSVFLGDTANPCPKCVGESGSKLNDGKQDGTCDKGARAGQKCDGNGTAVLVSFGVTSLDCPPGGTSAADLSIDFSGSTGLETRTLDASSPNCNQVSATVEKCFCAPEGQTTQPNACTDEFDTPDVDESICQPDAGSPREGHCPGGPVDQNCKKATFIGCTSNNDCTTEPGDECGAFPRACYLDNGAIGGKVEAQGQPDPPSNGESDPTFASLFCIGSTRASAVNTAAGLPGLGRVELPLHAKEILP
jgi:hypothetical protein